jgi:hypothetical protein
MGFQSPQFESPVNMMGNMMKLKSMQQQNALAEQQMGDLAAERARVAATNEAYRNAYNPETGEIDYNAIANVLAKKGQGSGIGDLFKARDEREKARYERLSAKGKAFTEESNVFQAQLNQVDPSDPQAPLLMEQFIRGHHAPGSVTAEILKNQGITVDQSLAALRNAVQTGTLPDFLKRSQLGAAEFIKANAPKFTQVDAGGYTFTQQMPGLGGPATEVKGSRVTKTLSPAEKARLDAETQTGAFSEDSIDLMAALVAQGYPLPITLGRGSKSDALKNTIMERAGRIAQGLSPRAVAPAPAGTRPGAVPAAPATRATPATPAPSAADVASIIGGARQDQQSVTGSMRYYTSGRGNQIITSLNTAVDHLDTLSELATALGNKDLRIVNRVGQAWKQQTGQAAPTNLDAAKVVIAREVLKAITATGGGVVEAEELQSTMDKVNSPEQLAGVVKTLQELLAGQLDSIGTQYKATTRRNDFDERLSDRTKRVLGRGSNAEGGDEKRKALLDKYKD